MIIDLSSGVHLTCIGVQPKHALDDEEETDAEVRSVLQEHAHADAHDVQRAAVAPADLRRRERVGRRSALAIPAAALLALLLMVAPFIYRQTLYLYS